MDSGCSFDMIIKTEKPHHSPGLITIASLPEKLAQSIGEGNWWGIGVDRSENRSLFQPGNVVCFSPILTSLIHSFKVFAQLIPGFRQIVKMTAWCK